MARIFIFNPETDYALALGRRHYSMPKKIRQLRSSLQLVQAMVAHPGDSIVVDDGFDPDLYLHPEHLQQAQKKKLTLVPRSALRLHLGPEKIITPWGWNHTLRNELLREIINQGDQLPDEACPAYGIPSAGDIDSRRLLSHRRTAIAFRETLTPLLPAIRIDRGEEFTSVEKALDYAASCREVYFKAPWSSSGRGVVTSVGFATPEKMREWLAGCIRSQGSVTAEIGTGRLCDFASEWILDGGEARFRGLSLFETTSSGKYLGNFPLSYNEIMSRLEEFSPEWSDRIISAQKDALEELIAPGYEGPVGIDMLITDSRRVNPCVELNLRLTMGMMALGDNFYPPE